MNELDLAKRNADHIATLNKEMGEIRDEVKDVKAGVSSLKNDFTAVKTDVAWLKKFFFIVATSSIGALIASLVSIILNR